MCKTYSKFMNGKGVVSETCKWTNFPCHVKEPFDKPEKFKKTLVVQNVDEGEGCTGVAVDPSLNLNKSAPNEDPPINLTGSVDCNLQCDFEEEFCNDSSCIAKVSAWLLNSVEPNINRQEPSFLAESAKHSGEDSKTLARGGIVPPEEKLEATDEQTRFRVTTEASKGRPRFFLASSEEGSVSSIEPPAFLPVAAVFEPSKTPDLSINPDLYPIPKFPQSRPSSLDDPPPAQETQTEEELFDTSPTRPSASGISEEDIKNRIFACLARAKSRGNHHSGLGSFEAGLYRLEALVAEGEGHKGNSQNRGKFPIKNGSSAVLMPELRDTGTITDVCAGDDIPEVEIISIVQEQIPCYKLRADAASKFSGYDQSDWTVPFPALKDSEVEALSPEQAEGVLAYFGKFRTSV